MSDFLNRLQKRSLLNDISHPQELTDALAKSGITFYCGFDPTADSLHVGSMLPLIMMRRLQVLGHTPIAVLGTATGMIGDPSGKSSERQLLDNDAIEHNALGLEKQVKLFLSFEGDNAASIVRNGDWTAELSAVAFLRDVGKHFSVNAMMMRDSVKSRLEDREHGISYTEFSYALLQAYDFYWLYKHKNCVLQIGGSDQWGNITAGIDFTRRKMFPEQGEVYGMTFPLITTASGTKFGKTESGNIWLDPKRTSPYRFYQYWLNTDDADVLKYLLYFTELDGEELEGIQTDLREEPQKRGAQKHLAEFLTTLVHGPEGLQRAAQATKALFGGSLENIEESALLDIFADVPTSSLEAAKLSTGIPVLDLLTECGLAKSKGEARRLIEGGGLNINNNRISDTSLLVGTEHLATQSVMILRSGKKKYHLVRVEAA